jgi:hypothetical protein
MPILLPLAGLLLLQIQGKDTALTARIQRLVHDALTTQDDKQEAAAEAEVKAIFQQYSLPGISAVGDEAAYEFVLLTCSPGPLEFQNRVLRKVREAANRGDVPADAATYCAAHVRQEMVKTKAKKHRPANPALREQIEQLFKADQEVREKNDFDMEKMSQTDQGHRAFGALQN